MEKFNLWKAENRERYLLGRRQRKQARLKAGSQEIRRQILGRYKLTLEQYSEMLAKQDDACAICGDKETGRNQHGPIALSVDHDHGTGQVRGLLCRRCNMLLGAARDNCAILDRAANYIVNHYVRERKAANYAQAL